MEGHYLVFIARLMNRASTTTYVKFFQRLLMRKKLTVEQVWPEEVYKPEGGQGGCSGVSQVSEHTQDDLDISNSATMC
jgi:hypothetical protein